MQTNTLPPLEYATPSGAVEESRVFAKITWLLIPFMFLMYVVGYLDRINVGFAALTMKTDLKLSERAYGLGAGIFFAGYFFFELPSNLILERVGARRWIARIMVSWGILACAMMFIRGPISFNSLRFLLGAAEAGFFPGMVLYLTYWFPAKRRAQAMSVFLTSTAIAGVVGAPISAVCLSMNGIGHLAGWQWLFLLEGLPSIALGVVVLFYLPDGPRQAKWLSAAEKDWLDEHLRDAALPHQRRVGSASADGILGEPESIRSGTIPSAKTDPTRVLEYAQPSPEQHRHTLIDALGDWRLWLLSGNYFLLICGLYTFSLWAPAILKKAVPALSDVRVSLLLGIPYGVASVGMVLLGHHSDRTGERHWHIAIPAAIACIGLSATAFVHTAPMAIATLSVAALGIWGTLGTFWTLPTAFLRGSAAAGGIAIVNSLGCLSGLVAPWLVGISRDVTGGFAVGLIGVGVTVLCGGILVFAVSGDRGEAGHA